MTATIVKSKKALQDLQSQAQATSKTTDGIVKSSTKASEGLKGLAQDADRAKTALGGIKNSSVSVSIRDMVTSPLSSIKSGLGSIAGKSYSVGIHAKDSATDTILKVKSELSGIMGKTYTAILNVKANTNPMNSMGNTLNEFTNGMLMPTSIQMAGAAGIGYGVYDTIKTSMDFDAQLSAIKSLTPKEGIDGISRNEIMEQVRQRAKELGQATAFGNKEVAQGMTELIKAGISLKDVLGDASEAALNLATAGDLALPEAAEIMSTAMNTFGVKDATHAANILAGAANASATSVHEMKYSLSAVGIVAKKAGMDFDEVNTALALMASRGLKGSDAGTSLKSMLQQIEPASKPAVAAFERLGLLKDGKNQFYDEKGQLRSLGEIADILHESTQGLTEQELNSLYKDAFGSDGIRAAQVLGEFTSESIKDMYNEITKVTAKEQSETMLDNLKGDIEQLGGAWENFQDTLMEGSATGGLRSLVKEITELVLDANKLFENGFTFWGTFDLVTKPFRDAFSKMIQMDGMSSVAAGAGLFIGLIAGAKKFYNIVAKSVQSVKNLIDIAKGIPKDLPGSVPNNLPTNLPGQTVKDVILNAQNVYVNGKNQPGETPPVVPNEPSAPPTDKPKTPPAKPTIWSNTKDAIKTGWNYGGGINKANIALTVPFAAYDIYGADEGEKGAAVARAGGGIAGGWAGAKIGGAAGAAIGSVFPGIGTGAGAIIGGAIGGIGGSILGSQFADSISRLFDFSADYNIIKRINDSSWGQAQNMANQTQIALPQMQYDSTMTNFSGIGDTVQNISDMQFQSSQIQIEGQKQAFSEFKDFVSNIWNEITDTTNTAGQMQLESSQIQTEGQMQLLSGLRDFATEIWNSIQQAGISAWENIQAKWNEAVSWFSSNICSPLENLAQSAGTGIAAGINSAITTIQSAWAGVVNWFETNVFSPIRQKYIELKNSAPSPVQSVLSFVDGGIGKNATGTMNWTGGLTEINEQGGEIVDLPTGSRIYPAQTTERIIQRELAENTSNTGGGNVTITGNTFIVRNEQDIDEIAYRLMSLMRQVNANFGGAY
nr:MAG TPA_asm: minor tail protein [Caudoviricetes sp.]